MNANNFYWEEDRPEPEYDRRHMWSPGHCSAPEGVESVLVRHTYYGGPGQFNFTHDVCHPKGAWSYWGWTAVGEGTAESRIGEHMSAYDVGYNCATPTPNGPPWVEVTGTVEVDNPSVAEESQPFANAEVQLWYRSEADDVSEWLPVRGVGGEGAAVVGHTNERGEFTLEFVYPQDYELDGEMWIGCPMTDPHVPFMSSHACADGDVELRVLAKSQDGALTVRDPGGSEPAVAARIPLGRFFERDPGHVYATNSNAALAYVKARDVHALTADLPDDYGLSSLSVQLHGGPVTPGSRYDRQNRVIHVDQADAPFSDVAFLTGLAYHDDLNGGGDPVPDCHAGVFATTSDELCAFRLGFAAALADHVSGGPDGPGVLTLLREEYDIEACVVVGTACEEEGATVAARVAAAVRDLLDRPPDTDPVDETRDGFTDAVDHPFAEVAAAVVDVRATTAEEFWDGWRARHGSRDRLIMFMNTLEYSHLLDEQAFSASGSWASAVCQPCREQDMIQSGGLPGDIATTTVTGFRQEGAYDVWLRVPDGGPASAHEVKVDVDGHVRVLDQSTMVDGWHNVFPGGAAYVQDDGAMRVAVSSSDAGVFTVDAVIVAPHEDESVGPFGPVRATGKVETWVTRPLVPERPLSHACYELLYEGHDGSIDSPVTWRPVLDSRGPNGAPAGNPVRGCLNANGEFDVTFTYPHRYELDDGTTWVGCELPASPVEFLGAYACADDKIVLRVWAQNADESAKVKPQPSDSATASMVEEVGLGNFFLRDSNSGFAESSDARAYGAIHTVREFVGRDVGDLLITMHEGDSTTFNPFARVIMLSRYDRVGVAERNVAFAFDHHQSGGGADWPVICDFENQKWSDRVSENCAWRGGLATFIAASAQHRYASDPDEAPKYDNRYDLEQCDAINCSVRGADVEGAIAMTLYDFVDYSPDEDKKTSYGIRDASNHPLAAVLDVARDSDADDYDEFWWLWHFRYDEDNIDKETTVRNHVRTVLVIDDSSPAIARTGRWDLIKDTPDTMDNSYVKSSGTASLTWRLGPSIREDGVYEVWVKIPPADDVRRHERAVYTITTADGPRDIYVNLNEWERWLKLDARGHRFEAGEDLTITLRHADGTTPLPLVADSASVRRACGWCVTTRHPQERQAALATEPACTGGANQPSALPRTYVSVRVEGAGFEVVEREQPRGAQPCRSEPCRAASRTEWTRT